MWLLITICILVMGPQCPLLASMGNRHTHVGETSIHIKFFKNNLKIRKIRTAGGLGVYSVVGHMLSQIVP